ncbi:MAG: MarR family winged helix-turn-helix transcriptional regulator, partial [Pseudomonadota bacterium]
VASCEAQRLVKTVADATDGRAKIVTFTNLGRTIIDTERELMERMDADLTSVLGIKGFAALRRSLHCLSEWAGPFDDDMPAKRAAAPADRAAPRRRNGARKPSY